MPEKFPLPEIKGRPEKSERDITQGKISQDGRFLSWKKEGPLDPIVEGKAEGMPQVIEVVKKEEPKGIILKKSDNIIKMVNAHGPRAQKYYRSRQESVEKEKRMTRRAKDDLTSNEPEKYEALFNQ